jgi:NADP-dependent 3-hydroxy acid dehydrogenase YdfG
VTVAGQLEGKVALVTGASSGIGEATAIALAAEGAKVALAARRQDRLEALQQKLVSGGAEATTISLDVTDEQQCRDAVAATRNRLGGLDIVINNAGLMLLGPILDADTEDWRRMINTNVLGLMYLTHAALPHLVAQRSGDIVNISSVAGRVARLGSGAYNASKWGVNAFTESLRQEVTERGVRVSVVEPGLVDTELGDHITNAEAKAATKEWKASIRSLTADDIARSIVFVVSQPDHVAINEVLVRPTDQAR